MQRHRTLSGSRSQRGLTVLEVLLASTMLLMFLSSLFGLVWSIAEFRDQIEQEVRPYDMAPPVLALVVQDLNNVLVEPYKDRDAFKGEGDTIGGEDTTKLDFVTAVSSRSAVEIDDEFVKSAICEIGYRVRRSEVYDDLFALYRREDFGVDEEPFEGGKYYKLADRIASFRIDFYEEDPGKPEGDEAKGLQDWDAKEQGGLPYGCRITLVVVPPYETDEDGNALEELQEITFVRYVAFPQRFDVDAGGSSAPAGR